MNSENRLKTLILKREGLQKAKKALEDETQHLTRCPHVDCDDCPLSDQNLRPICGYACYEASAHKICEIGINMIDSELEECDWMLYNLTGLDRLPLVVRFGDRFFKLVEIRD